MKAPRLRSRILRISATCLIIFLILFWDRIVYVIPAGSVGVLWLSFWGGTVKHYYLKQGVKIIAPWDKIYIYDVRLRRKDVSVTAHGSDGLEVKMDVTLNYSLNKERVPFLHQEAGENYEEVGVVPELVAAVSRAITKREGKELFSIKRDAIESEVQASLQRRFRTYASLKHGEERQYLSIDGFSIRGISLASTLTSSIEEKISAEQFMQEMMYIREAKAIEAEAASLFQKIVSPGINENLLKWQGIDATNKLAESKNSKIVIIGNNEDGLPIINDASREKHIIVHDR